MLSAPSSLPSVCLTFDNLGEAAELEFGAWAADRPVGAHYTVREVLPRLLPLLDGIACTFFIEAWNVAPYGAVIGDVAARGHEVAMHGWRHEHWTRLDAESERDLLEASLAAFDTLGLRPVGFRPPGGSALPSTESCVRELGLRYVSAAGGSDSASEGLASVPFRWDAVDAFYLEPLLDRVRVQAGRPGPVEPLQHWQQAARDALQRLLDEGGHQTFLFHPYLIGAHAEQFAWLEQFVQMLRAAPVSVLTCAQRAQQLLVPPARH